jgi:murein DD-endopeptidase MepM/ murein hydrolase activator NlpD
MRLIRTDAELFLGRQLAVCLCALFLCVAMERTGKAAGLANPVAAPAASVAELPAFAGRLLGVMESQMTRKAMIALDGVEQPVLVSQGDLVAGYTVESIDEDAVSIRQGAATRNLFVFTSMKYVASNKSAKTVKDVPSEAELAVAKAAKPFKSRVGKRPSLSDEPEEVEVAQTLPIRPGRGDVPLFLYPLGSSGRVSSPFGDRERPRTRMGSGSKNHKGTDIAVPSDTRVLASAPGIVKKVGSVKWGEGNYIIISHSGGYETHYYHLNDRVVRVGDHVRAKQLIGHSGNTGNSSGPHLHFQIMKGDRPVDASDYLPVLQTRRRSR